MSTEFQEIPTFLPCTELSIPSPFRSRGGSSGVTRGSSQQGKTNQEDPKLLQAAPGASPSSDCAAELPAGPWGWEHSIPMDNQVIPHSRDSPQTFGEMTNTQENPKFQQCRTTGWNPSDFSWKTEFLFSPPAFPSGIFDHQAISSISDTWQMKSLCLHRNDQKPEGNKIPAVWNRGTEPLLLLKPSDCPWKSKPLPSAPAFPPGMFHHNPIQHF